MILHVYLHYEVSHSIDSEQNEDRDTSKNECLTFSKREIFNKIDTCFRELMDSVRHKGEAIKEVTDYNYPARRSSDALAYYYCTECSYSTGFRVQMKHHMILHGSGNEFNCDACPKQFPDELHTKSHSEMSAFIDQQVQPEQHLCGVAADCLRPFTCELCSEKFDDWDKFKHHMVNHFDIDDNSDVPKKKKHKGPPKYPIQCDECDALFDSELEMLEHVKLHNQYFQCDHCEFRTKTGKRFEMHLRSHDPHRCSLCLYETNKKREFKDHTRTLHPLSTIVTCHICQFQTNSENFLKVHIKRHDDQSWQPSSQDKREGTSPQAAVETSAPKRRKLLKEEDPNVGNKCHLCSYTSKNRSVLNRHLLTHTGEKPFSCSHCPYRCARKDNFQSHLKMHMKRNS